MDYTILLLLDDCLKKALPSGITISYKQFSFFLVFPYVFNHDQPNRQHRRHVSTIRAMQLIYYTAERRSLSKNTNYPGFWQSVYIRC